ncbi:MAG: hypothetical protein H8F28_25350 [Fibrella sp.]|nr:hypothetical protein [Armatimonadota bacterium]
MTSYVGRGSASDPIGYEGGINLYAYCDGNPVMGIDPDGLSRKTISLFNGKYSLGIDKTEFGGLDMHVYKIVRGQEVEVALFSWTGKKIPTHKGVTLPGVPKELYADPEFRAAKTAFKKEAKELMRTSRREDLMTIYSNWIAKRVDIGAVKRGLKSGQSLARSAPHATGVPDLSEGHLTGFLTALPLPFTMVKRDPHNENVTVRFIQSKLPKRQK